MTEMRRITFSIPDDMSEQLDRIMQKDEFSDCSCSEVLRRLILVGIKSQNRKKKKEDIQADESRPG